MNNNNPATALKPEQGLQIPQALQINVQPREVAISIGFVKRNFEKLLR